MKKKLGVFGAGGLIGSELIKYLDSSYEIHVIKSHNLYSAPEELSKKLADLDVVINLAGHPVAGRWNKRIKERIYESRVTTTRNLVSAISLMKNKPPHLINASAVGLYADGSYCDENSNNYAENFLAKVISEWEKEALRIKDFGVELTILRIGIVLSTFGGAYSIIRKIFKIGLGGVIGNGKQGFTFILLEDLVRIVDFVIKEKIYGIVNAVSPVPVSNKVFTKELAKILKRPAFIPIPDIIIKIIFGEGSCAMLEGQKAIPSKLKDMGFTFVGNNVTASLKILEK
jgi:uncharacterized protein (TIGR01777 family)